MICCSREAHEALKADRAEYRRGTYFIGMQDYGEGEVIALRNCRVCNSTLAVEGDVDHEVLEPWVERFIAEREERKAALRDVAVQHAA